LINNLAAASGKPKSANTFPELLSISALFFRLAISLLVIGGGHT
jgi:hypothetical protein